MRLSRSSVWPRARRLVLVACAVLAAHLWLLDGLRLAPAGRPERGPATIQARLQVPAAAQQADRAARADPRPVRDATPRPHATRAVHRTSDDPADATSVPARAVVAAAAEHVAFEPAAAQTGVRTTHGAVAMGATEDVSVALAADPSRKGVPAGAPGPAASAAPTASGAPATRASVPAPMTLHYLVVAQSHGLSITGRGELGWQHDGRHYELRMDSGGFPLPPRSQRSAGAIKPEGLAPARFSDRRRSEEAVHFDRDRGKLVFSANQREADIEPGAQDRLSVLMQMAALVAARGGRVPAGTEYALQVAGTKEAQPWQFRVEGEETLQLPGGEVRAVKLLRLPRKEYDLQVELWIAPGRDYAPVRLRLTQPNGDSLDQQWSGTDKR